jgi:hypothetical protein
MSDRLPITIDTLMPPPGWALLERELLRFQSEAFRIFYNKYFDERGYLECIPRWGALDGPDDAIENLANWPVLYLLGGDDDILDMCRRAYDGHIKQYTEAKTVDVPFARDGMYYREFPVHSDWAHHAEGLVVFNLMALCDPGDQKHIERARRFAGFYMGGDPQAPNYDPEHKIIRSMFNGSRGPMLRKTTPLDWVGDPLEDDRFNLLHGQKNYAEMVERFQIYVDVAGDHPLNLTSTGLAFNAYALTGDCKYKNWILEYADAWVERTYQNGGVIPSNVGLDGTIGGACEGRWWGGTYGWNHKVSAHRYGRLDTFTLNAVQHAVDGFGNALLLTGDQKYVDVWRTVLDTVKSNSKMIDSVEMYPHLHGDDGWYEFKPEPYAPFAMEIYDWSMNPDDLQRIGDHGWLDFLAGKNPAYPVETFQSDFGTIRTCLQEVRDDLSTPDTRLSDNPNPFNPATVEGLVNLMTGGTRPAYARPLHCRLWYFDPQKQRAGMPADVAALVDHIEKDYLKVHLVNTNPNEARSIIVQGGAYAEHQIKGVSFNGENWPVDDTHVNIGIAAGSGVHATIELQRYVNQPTATFPWDR